MKYFRAFPTSQSFLPNSFRCNSHQVERILFFIRRQLSVSTDSGGFVYYLIKWNISRQLSILTLPAHRVDINLKLIKLLNDYFLFTHRVNQIMEIKQGKKMGCLAGYDLARCALLLAEEAYELYHIFSCANPCGFHFLLLTKSVAMVCTGIGSQQASVSMWNPSVLEGKVKSDLLILTGRFPFILELLGHFNLYIKSTWIFCF